MRAVLVSLDWFQVPDVAGTCLRDWARRDDALRGVSIELAAFTRDKSAADAARELAALEPALAGFTCYVWNVAAVLEICAELKRLRPSVKIVLGGAEPAPIPEKMLGAHPQVDFVALGEGEETFRLLLRAVALGDAPVSSVPGLAYRDGVQVVRTPVAPLIDLDAMTPVYDGAAGTGHKALLETARGCPFLCSFCDWGPRKMRYVPLDRVEREIAALSERYKLVILCDADPLMEKERGLALMEKFYAASRGKEFVVQFDTNPVFLWDEAIDIVARDPAVFHFSFGLQSTNPATIKRIHRPFDLPRMEKNLRELKRRAPDARIAFSIIYGLPGDSLDSFRSTVDWVLQWKPTTFGANQLVMLPGADIVGEKPHPKLVYQKDPPYQVYETDAMDRADMARARELSYYASLLFGFRWISFSSCADALFEGLDPLTMAPGSRVALVEGWIEHVKKAGIDLTFGKPVIETDEFVQRHLYMKALERLSADKLSAAALLHATRLYAAGRRVPA